MNETPVRYTVAWFRPEHWEELKALCPGELQDTFEEWYANARAGLKGLGVTEDQIEKSILTPDDLKNWQASNVGPIDSVVRARLALELASQRRENPPLAFAVHL
jgi:hypothetical protein